MTYKLAKELKDAGFPQVVGDGFREREDPYAPTLSELIEACGITLKRKNIYAFASYNRESEEIGNFSLMGYQKKHTGCEHCTESTSYHNEWSASYLFSRSFQGAKPSGYGSSPDEAVAKLWIALNKPKET